MSLNPALFELAQRRVWQDAGGPLMEKVAVVPPDPAMGGGGAPPMDPAMAGGAPPMDPAAMGGAAPPMGGAPPMGVPPMPGAPPMGGAAPGMGVDPNTGMPPKMKPEQMMQMLDFRLYNMQQQITALMNAMGVQLPPGALVTPPGSPTPVAEAAVPGGPQDPSQDAAGGGGGQSAISPIEPMQGASPELAAGGGGGGGGGEKMGQANNDSFASLIEKMAEGDKANTRSTDGDVDSEGPRHSSAPQALKGPHPGVRPSTQNISAGGSKDPLSRTEASDGMGAVNKAASFGQAMGDRDPSRVGTPYETFQNHSPANNAAAVAAMLRRRTVGAA